MEKSSADLGVVCCACSPPEGRGWHAGFWGSSSEQTILERSQRFDPGREARSAGPSLEPVTVECRLMRVHAELPISLCKQDVILVTQGVPF